MKMTFFKRTLNLQLALFMVINASVGLGSQLALAAVPKNPTTHQPSKPFSPVTNANPTNPARKRPIYHSVDQRPFFDLPMTYNSKVKKWILYFQGEGRRGFKVWLERSHRYMPSIQKTLQRRGLPLDLAYVAMIESGFRAKAVSPASAVGYWQFIEATANRYGLRTNWWLDERRDYRKSTHAASQYLGDLYKMFDSWYLAVAAYNMGEARLKRLIKRHQTKNFWALAKQKGFPSETRDYIPKLIAAILIAKAPKLYGFRNIQPRAPYAYEYFYVPGGTDLKILADHIGVNYKNLAQLNPELIKGFIPPITKGHKIRIPRGTNRKVASYIRKTL
ncbi:MAG: lytic transglycosylase domain-containing protein [Pseudobdellovibrionaceae bacterium]|nr:lytic transglycosylase domain-containing protein [Bdellovibrionales bacterium]USN46489.1 MAG: lytic transglycosylase domain-containing protein [Pseudobdellovibrionaceae bacterium]